MNKGKAVRIREAGGPEVLALETYEVADPGPGEVLVRVAAAGLNRADCLQRRGFYPAPQGVVADVPGLEFAGTVEKLGEGVEGYEIGAHVMGIVAGGAMATHLLTPANHLLRVPKKINLEEAAAIPEVFMTVYDAVFRQADLKAGETLLVHAIASGIGTAAIQLAAAFSAHCIGTTRSAEKLARSKALGLEAGVVVEDKSFREALKQLAPDGVDVILDTVGAAYLEENIKSLALAGRIVVIGLMGGVKAELPLGVLLAKRATLIGSVLRSRSDREKSELTQAFSEHVLPFFEQGKLAPVIDAVLPMSEIAEAHRRMDANETFGKIVMKW